ncbi:MAG: antirestriction protein ArdA, partial [Erysipelotrichaceae bacterium]|nr:antirestriction protein ArdA [Erysipelotrichaceae bacterium]
MSENKQLDRVKEITDQLEAGIHDLFESERYQQWLTTMSRFHNYSLNNTMLIAMQKPEATLVAGYTAWQKQFGRQVQKGEKGIKILAPAPYKEMVEMDKIDPDTRLPVLDENGDPVKEEQEVTRPAYKVVSVFDVSQTDGKELPTIGVNELTGDVERYEQFFEALKLSCPVPMEFENIQGGAKGYYHQTDKRIAIQEGMSQLQTVKTAIHEMAHQKLHSMENDLTKNSKEVEAESVAYTVCQHFGIDTSDYSFGYIAGWSEGKETPELKASLQTIRNAAKEMINDIEGHLLELTKENDIEKDAEDLAVKLDRFAYDYDYYGYHDAVDDPEESVL